MPTPVSVRPSPPGVRWSEVAAGSWRAELDGARLSVACGDGSYCMWFVTAPNGSRTAGRSPSVEQAQWAAARVAERVTSS